MHDELAALAGESGATTFMVYLAAFGAFLQRLSGQDTVVVGTPTSHRDRPELEPLVGLFTNTLPVRLDLAGAPSFADLVERTRDTVLDVFQHKDLPFEKLVEIVRPPRQLSVPPIFQVMFSHQKGLQAITLDAAGGANVAVAGAKFDLTLYVNETPEGVTVVLEHAADVFDEATARGFLAQFARLLEEVAQDPHEIAERVPLADPQATGSQDEAPETVPDVIAAIARAVGREPGRIVLEADGAAMDGAAFLTRVGALARGLAARGVAEGDVVAVHLGRGGDLALMLAAVLAAGATYLNVAPDLPLARKALILADSGAVLVVGAPIPDEGGRPVPTASVAELAAERAEEEAVRPAPARPLPDGRRHGYLVYTSGTTGTPKGVLVPRDVLDRLVAWQVAQPDFAPGLRTLQMSRPGFDVSLQEMLACWASGGTLVAPGEAVLANPGLWGETIARERIERLFLPAVALQQLAIAAQADGAAGLRLREVVTAGERLVITPQIRAFFAGPAAGATLVNQYGPSETHVVTAWTLAGDPADWEEAPPIGRPVWGARLHVLDRHGAPVAPGLPGELCVGGSPLALGYLGASERTATAERFLPDPTAPRGGAGRRIYATGDRVRLRHDGALVFLGRADEQVKIRGYRVEPAEIEQVLAGRDDVAQAIVVAHRFAAGSDSGGVGLVAYVEPAPGARLDPHALDAHLRAVLPDFMVPAAFVVIDAVPKTASGKVDRAALPLPVRLVRRDVPRIAPRTERERQIAAVWREVLGLDEVGVEESFFDLGGQSLMATQVVARLAEGHGFDVPLRRLFETPTIAGLAAGLDGGVAGDGSGGRAGGQAAAGA